MKAESFSVNEVQTTIQKSFEAVGVPWDVDFRAAVVAAWLEQCGFDGVRAAVRAVDAHTRAHPQAFEPVAGDTPINERINASDQSALTAGGYLLDYAVAMSIANDGDPFVLEVEDITDAFAVVGWLGTGQFDCAVEVRASGPAGSVCARQTRERPLQIQRTATATDKEKLVVGCALRDDPLSGLGLANDSSESSLSKADVIQMQQQAVTLGLTPPVAAWRELKQAAKGVLVPSTDISRAVGTGGGDANE